MKIDALVFAGGGGRCLWQVGFWEQINLKLKPDLRAVGAVSAGALMSVMIFADKIGQAMKYFNEKTSLNKKNFYPENIFRNKPVFPHYDMYHSLILDIIDENSMKKLHSGPDIRVMLTRPPAWLGPLTGTIAGLALYSIEKKIKNSVHPEFASRIGFKNEKISVRQCSTPEELADLILQSSCTPPVVPVMYRDGMPVLDGGVVDNVPVNSVNDIKGVKLVMLTRSYPEEKLIFYKDRIYVYPSEPIKLKKWDFTNPAGLMETYDLGRRDGDAFVKRMQGSKEQGV